MGVTGLWRLVEPAGKPVPVETLENKVLAVDISIWLHQVVKGYQDAKGAPLPNAHLIGLFQRLCKLLYFRIKPIFVFDGAFPELKKETIAKRQDSKNKYHSESERLKRELAVLLSKKTAIGSLLGKQISPTKKSSTAIKDNDDLFKLPAMPQREESEEESSDEEDTSSGSIVDLHSVDLQSNNFKSMPAKEKYDLLLELKETRKMNSWGKLHTLPKKSDNFSDFQMQRLLKRRKVQECIEETEKEIGDVGMSMNELESLLNEEGIDTKVESLPTRRIAANNNTRYLLISSVKESLAKAKEKREAENKPQTSTSLDIPEADSTEKCPAKHDELEDDLERAIQMSLECCDEPNTSVGQSKTDESWTSVLTDTDYSDMSDSEEELEQPDISTAKAYIMQYSDYTTSAIEKLVAPGFKKGKKKSKASVDKIIEEVNKEKSIILANVELSSSDEESRSDLGHSNNAIKANIDTKKQTEDGFDEFDENVESTQASVMFIENTGHEVISLDSSFDEAREAKQINNLTHKSISSNNYIDNDDDFDEVPENIEIDKETVSNVKGSINDIESSDIDKELEEVLGSHVHVQAIEPVSNVKAGINLKGKNSSDTDNEFEDVPESAVKAKYTLNNINKSINVNDSLNESSDTDDEFEEVPEVEDKSRKPIVQLTLKVDDVLNDDDDIFADVFLPVSNAIKGSNITDEKEPTYKENEIKQEIISQDTEHVSLTSRSPSSEAKTKQSTSPENRKDNFTDDKSNTGQKSNFISMDQDSNVGFISKSNTESLKEPTTIMQSEEKDNICNNPSELESISINDANTNNTTSNKKLTNNDEQIKTNTGPVQPLNTEKLNSMVEEIQSEEQGLIQEKGRLDRIGRNITEQMTKEAQELLQIFGIPYIVAPMEAEAQCAFLESVKLTDGTITDDSDIWLFGGQTVYKNFFNQKKHVLQYISERIEKSFNLSREQLILLALLVGSDYTTGIAGVGPVTAMEILASFPFNKRQVLAETSKQVRYAKLLDGLKEFKVWVKAGKRTDNTSLKKKLRNVTLSDDFPSMRVVQAYLEPNVEKSEDKFTWGELDITVLRDYAKSKFGWSQQKFDEIIKPVLARMKDQKKQKTVQDYFKRTVEFQALDEQMSKRLKAAVQKMGPEEANILINSDEPKNKAPKKRKKVEKKTSEIEAGPSIPKQRKKETDFPNIVKVVSEVKDARTGIEINIPKTDRYQETIPQREKDKQHLLENKMKAIEIFRKTTIDRKRKTKKRKPILPKDKANLSESSSSD